MTQLKKVGFSALAFAVTCQQSIAAGMSFEWTAVDDWLRWSDSSADAVIQKFANYFIWLMGLVAVLYMIYGWYLVLTAGWDEAKPKKWKAIIVQAAIWMLIAFLAYSIVQWVTSSLFWSATTGA